MILDFRKRSLDADGNSRDVDIEGSLTVSVGK
jgi:hypothetical protein